MYQTVVSYWFNSKFEPSSLRDCVGCMGLCESGGCVDVDSMSSQLRRYRYVKIADMEARPMVGDEGEECGRRRGARNCSVSKVAFDQLLSSSSRHHEAVVSITAVRSGRGKSVHRH
jgi:hypothetical protein